MTSAGHDGPARNKGLTSEATHPYPTLGPAAKMTSSDTTAEPAEHAVREVVSRDRVVIRFAGDSGDGMQLTGDRFTSETASFGNDLSTLPNFPAEIRAPAGTLPGVSSFQLHFAELRHPHPRRPPRRAGRDEPGRAQGEHRRPPRAAAC